MNVVIYTLNKFSYFVMRVCGPRLQHLRNVALRAKTLPTPVLAETLSISIGLGDDVLENSYTWLL